MVGVYVVIVSGNGVGEHLDGRVCASAELNGDDSRKRHGAAVQSVENVSQARKRLVKPQLAALVCVYHAAAEQLEKLVYIPVDLLFP